MASNFYDDFDSYCTSSDSDLDDEDDDAIEKDHCSSTYPGAVAVSSSLHYSPWMLPPVIPQRLSPQTSPVPSSSEGQLCSRLSAHLQVSKGAEAEYCRAFKNFSSQIKMTVSTYHFLDPALSRQFVKGKFDLDNSGMVMLQGAMINAIAHWEEYIVELLKEGFSIFVEVASGSPPNLYTLKKKLPSCDTILRKELRQSCQDKPADEMMYNLLWSVNPPRELRAKAAPWVEYFDSYCQTTISGTQLLPVFSSTAANSIDALFNKLFHVTAGGGTSLSEQLLQIGRFRFKLRLNQDEEIDVQIHSTNALKNISRLYYALRCVFAHGHNQKTMTGALKDFPRNVAEFELGNDKAAKYFLGLYRRMERYGRDTSISYLTFINMVEFLKRAAFFLMRALAKWIYDSTNSCVWSYKPHV